MWTEGKGAVVRQVRRRMFDITRSRPTLPCRFILLNHGLNGYLQVVGVGRNGYRESVEGRQGLVQPQMLLVALRRRRTLISTQDRCEHGKAPERGSGGDDDDWELTEGESLNHILRRG